MDPDSIGYSILAAAALIALGFFACSWRALDSLNRGRIQILSEERGESLDAVNAFVDGSPRYTRSMDIGRTLSTLAFATGAVLLSSRIAFSDYVLAASAVIAAGVAIVVAHSLPRLVAGRAEETALALAVPIRLAMLLLSPISALAESVGSAFSRASAPSDDGTSEELREFLGERHVEEEEREMIDSIFELEETTAREIMVPRMDVVALPDDAPLTDAMDLIIKHGYSRLPVYGQSVDDVTGILYAKDLFPLVRAGNMAGNMEGRVGELARPAYFIPESKKVDELLRELQQRKVHIAVVVDEYGGTAGIVTIEDLLEQIVGEIQDEFDSEEEKIVEGKEGEAVFDATVSIDDVNDTLDLCLTGEDVDTIGGLVYERLGKVPLVGDRVEADGALISVVATTGRRITRVKVARVPVEAASENGAQTT